MNYTKCQCKDELFIPIIGYEDIYRIGNHGTVLSSERLSKEYQGKKTHYIPEGIKKPSEKNGYKFLWLHGIGKSSQEYVHRLVAKYFVPNPVLEKYVDHKDCDRLNNCFKNLRWVSGSVNVHNSNRHSKSFKARGITYHKSSKKWVAQIKMNKKGVYLGSFLTMKEAMKRYDEEVIKIYGDSGRTNKTINFS